ncbi:hypothetical protein D9756_005505 [Leucocoprinus leucothites]|uniref:DDE-1 domain-containing protein n=1 Tax=Leucocoprinus leucothites TaxID=201217 RepID=A0A8H5FZQ6_9AGAR|nr:hypothetical protein D9756_005505 [Leucoagaricus leucothites]
MEKAFQRRDLEVVGLVDSWIVTTADCIATNRMHSTHCVLEQGTLTQKKAFFDILKKTLAASETNEAITPGNIYGVDETGIQKGVGLSDYVIGPAGESIQHQQRSGDRENITIIVTICADGTSILPAVIFKGQAFRTSWLQNNPLNASIGHSLKGYTDGEIGIEWIKHFNQQASVKANGQQHLLLVDGHNSHYTYGFLSYAQEHKIDVLCYPSHSTHLYQGLDVVVFSVLKAEKQRPRWTKPQLEGIEPPVPPPTVREGADDVEDDEEVDLHNGPHLEVDDEAP